MSMSSKIFTLVLILSATFFYSHFSKKQFDGMRGTQELVLKTIPDISIKTFANGSEELKDTRSISHDRVFVGIHETNGTGYCSQEKEPAQPDSQIFEIFWEPENSEFSGGTSENAKPQIRFDDPAGFSGSLVWNTRYLEMTAEGRKWSPEDAVVTGILRRFDPDTKSLLVLRAEHLRNWVEKQL